jgi:hypothetical protein
VTAGSGGLDFGNHLLLTLACGDTASLGGSGNVGDPTPGVGDNPYSEVTLPLKCDSATDSITTPFDVGLSDDAGDEFRQFVVFGGDPNGTTTLTQKIVWAPEDAVYDANNVLQVPTTQVLIPPNTDPEDVVDVVFCDPGPTFPAGRADCLINRLIAEGDPLDPGKIQLTENYQFLGDPPRFR